MAGTSAGAKKGWAGRKGGRYSSSIPSGGGALGKFIASHQSARVRPGRSGTTHTQSLVKAKKNSLKKKGGKKK